MKKWMKLLLTITIVIVAFFISYPLIKKQINFIKINVPEVRPNFKEAPDFRLQVLNDDFVTLSSYKEKQSIILFFWAIACDYCREEIKILNYRYPEFLKDGCELLAINVLEPANIIENFSKINNLNFKILLDKGASVADAYDILGLPTFIFINKKGEIVFKGNYFSYRSYNELISK